MDVLDTTKFGDTMVQKVLAKRSNVTFVYGAKVNGYEIDEKTKCVKAVKTSNADHQSVPCDIVVMAAGPQAPYHMYEHLNGTVMPLIQGQGYVFDILYEDHSLHTGKNVTISETIPYSYSQYYPGKQRIAALFDLGCFEEPKFD